MRVYGGVAAPNTTAQRDPQTIGRVDRGRGRRTDRRDHLEPGATGQVELRGTPWTAHNAGDVAIDAGDRVRVERTKGLVLRVRKES